MFLYHGPADEIVPYAQAKRLRAQWCAAGASVRWSDYPGEHVSAYLAAVPAATAWMRARFAGMSVPDTCGLP